MSWSPSSSLIYCQQGRSNVDAQDQLTHNCHEASQLLHSASSARQICCMQIRTALRTVIFCLAASSTSILYSQKELGFTQLDDHLTGSSIWSSNPAQEPTGEDRAKNFSLGLAINLPFSESQLAQLMSSLMYEKMKHRILLRLQVSTDTQLNLESDLSYGMHLSSLLSLGCLFGIRTGSLGSFLQTGAGLQASYKSWNYALVLKSIYQLDSRTSPNAFPDHSHAPYPHVDQVRWQLLLGLGCKWQIDKHWAVQISIYQGAFGQNQSRFHIKYRGTEHDLSLGIISAGSLQLGYAYKKSDFKLCLGIAWHPSLLPSSQWIFEFEPDKETS